MRAYLPLLIAAAAGAQTYTNEFTNSESALVFTNGPGAVAYDPSLAPVAGAASKKDWDVTPSNGSVQVSGWVSLPQSYYDTYAGSYTGPNPAPGAGMNATTQITGLPSFQLGDVAQLSYRISATEANTAPTYMYVWLTRESGYEYSIHAGNATYTVTRSGPGDTGDYIYTYSNIAITNLYQDPSAPTFTSADVFTGVRFGGNIYVTFNQGLKTTIGQYRDIAFQSVSITMPTPVPEASTFGLALGGLALAGAAIRRRRKA